MWGYHRQGSCQAGFSAGISKGGRDLFIGAPGSWYWQGQMYSIDANVKFSYSPGIFGGEFGSSGQIIRQSLENRPAVVSTREGPERDDDSYLGYSLTLGYFNGDKAQGVAVGMPRAANLKGKIVLYTWNLTNHQNITGEQLGAYFGYAVATSDIDGDNLDDLIVGAPFFTEPNNEGKYEVGRVYVIYQGGSVEGSFRRLHTLDGINSKSRFGLSLASLGDMNLDGYGDFAVGAPYDGPNERGAVYIFHGSADGVRKKHSQLILAEDVAKFMNAPDLKTFGWSLAGGLDLDQNDYPDMSVGAYLSDTVFFFRSRPVVKVDAELSYLTPGKQIMLEDKGCTLRDGTLVPCTEFKICMNYTGIGVPITQDFKVNYVLDSKKIKGQRMFFSDFENAYILNETWPLRKDSSQYCKRKRIYLSNDIRDKLTALEVEVHYALAGYESSEKVSHRAYKAQLLPVVDLNTPPMRKDSIIVQKNCGLDNICIPNLHIFARPSVQKYLLGSNTKLEIDIIVQNEGEDSYESTFNLHLPPGVDFINVIEYEENNVKISCSLTPNNTINCDIGNPLPANKTIKFKVQLQPYYKEGMSPSYDFRMSVNSTNPELNQTTDDNNLFLSVNIWVDSTLVLSGMSKPAVIPYNYSSYMVDSVKEEKDIGPQVVHVYSIVNKGPSNINEAEVYILWPSATLADDSLLYLLEQPHTVGNVKCDFVEANTKSYKLEQSTKHFWETLSLEMGEKNGAAGTSTGQVAIEDGKTTYAQVGSETIKKTQQNETEFSTGDSSHIQNQRHKEVHSEGANSDGRKVIVQADTGRGSKTIITETRWNYTNSNRGPPINITYQERYYLNPDGTKVRIDSSSQHGYEGIIDSEAKHFEQSYGGGAIYGGSSSNIEASQGSLYQGGSRTGSSIHHVQGSVDYGKDSSYNGEQSQNAHISRTKMTQSKKLPNIVYSSSGSHYLQEAHQGQPTGEISSENHSTTSSSSGTVMSVSNKEAKGKHFPPHVNEDGSISAATTFVDFPYPHYRPPPPNPELLQGENGYDRSHNHGSSFESGVQIEEDGFKHPVHQGKKYELGHGDVELQRKLKSEARQKQHNYQQNYGQGSHLSNSASDSGRGHFTYGSYNHSLSEEEQRRYGIGAAALSPGGFKATGVELAPVGNIDQTVDEDARTSFNSHSGISAYGSNTGLIVEQPFSSHEQSYYTRGQGGASRTYSSSGEGYRGGYEKHYKSSYSSHGSYGSSGYKTSDHEPVGDNVPTSEPDLDNPIHRGKRDIAQDIELANVVQCKATKCIPIKCRVGLLLKEQEAFIYLRSRVNVHTLRNISVTQPITFSSMMLARISKLPYIGTPVEREVHSHEIFTTVLAPEPEIKPDIVPLWAIVLSAVAGTIILLLLVFLLYKCGFFKRNRPSDAPERQPLNRNGHFQHGDEAL